MMRNKLATGGLLGVILGSLLVINVEAQGPYTAQIQRAINALIGGSYTFTVIKAANGTAAAPSYTFANDAGLDSGFYLIGANNIGAAAGGALIWDWNATPELRVYTPGLAVTSAAKGLTILNATAATDAVKNQMSGRFTLRGTSWTGAASKTVEFFQEVLPANAATPTATWKLGYILEGVAAAYPMTLGSAGDLRILSTLGAGPSGVGNWFNVNAVGAAVANYFGLDTTNRDIYLSRASAGYLTLVGADLSGAGSFGLGASAAATSTRMLVKKVTAIADNTATDVLTVTIPNANHSAGVFLKLVVTNKHADDACESTRIATGAVAFARITDAVAVATAATIDDAAIATAGAATLTLAYNVSAVTGAAGASNSFTVQVTIDDSGNKGSNQCVVLAELINAEATGITVQ